MRPHAQRIKKLEKIRHELKDLLEEIKSLDVQHKFQTGEKADLYDLTVNVTSEVNAIRYWVGS